MKKFFAILLIASLCVITVGCLTYADKEYSWKINSNGSGSGTIVYRNIFSTGNTDDDYSAEDFVSLIEEYLEGETLENENPGMQNVKKRLFVENGVLCGEMSFEFKHYTDLNFYQYKSKGPIMFLLKDASETFVSSNGDWAGDNFPVVFWPENTKEFKIASSVDDPNEEGSMSLLPLYEDWKKTGSLPEVEEY